MRFYIAILITQAPIALLLAGALMRLRQGGGRWRRLQVAGAAILVAGAIGGVAVFSPHFGYDPHGVKDWTASFQTTERGAFWIGLLFFGLGYFIERRPRPSLVPWPLAWRAASAIALILFGGLAWVVNRNVSLPWLSLPWPVGHGIACLGLYPFSIAYVLHSRNAGPPPLD